MINHGHSKANRPDKKQVGIGSIVNHQGIPLVGQALNGNQSDCLWNQQAIHVLRDVLGTQLSIAIYIADCKLITMPNLHLLCDETAPVQFISRCPSSFYGKLTEQFVEQAYQEGQWSEPVSLGKKKGLTVYRTQSFLRTVEKRQLRFIVVETTSQRQALDSIVQREKAEFEAAVKALAKQTFACEKDAQTALQSFQKQNKKKLWRLNGVIKSCTQIVYKRGRRAANQPAQVERTDVTWQIGNQGMEPHQENLTKRQRQLMTFVLITNVVPEKLVCSIIDINWIQNMPFMLLCYNERKTAVSDMAKGRPRKYVISLTDDEVKKLKSILRKKTSCRTVRCRCQILLDLDIAHGKSLTHQQCAKSNGISTSTVMHALTLYTAEGLDATVTLKRNINSDNSRRKVDGRAEARLIELACGPTPHGHARWTMRLLADQ